MAVFACHVKLWLKLPDCLMLGRSTRKKHIKAHFGESLIPTFLPRTFPSTNSLLISQLFLICMAHLAEKWVATSRFFERRQGGLLLIGFLYALTFLSSDWDNVQRTSMNWNRPDQLPGNRRAIKSGGSFEKQGGLRSRTRRRTYPIPSAYTFPRMKSVFSEGRFWYSGWVDYNGKTMQLCYVIDGRDRCNDYGDYGLVWRIWRCLGSLGVTRSHAWMCAGLRML